MKIYSGILSGVALAIAILPLTASATYTSTPTLVAEGDFDGRHYEIYAYAGVSWHTANAAANAAIHIDVNGHLATITSAAEDAYIESLRASASASEGLAQPEVWVGGVTDSDCSPVPGCGWNWVNDEGPISTSQVPLNSYSNWLSPEPNNAGSGEKHLGVGLFGQFGWNDEGNLGLIGGYVVEYDTPTVIDPEECTGAEGCETTSGQHVTLPASALGNDPEIGIRTYEFSDDPSRCGVTPLVLFNTDADPDNDLIIPPYLCGSPKFLIVEVKTTNVSITEGTVAIENEVTEALPNNLYECTGPIDPAMLLSLADTLDPQHRDKVTYQRDNPEDMLEYEIGGTIEPVFAGAMTELTDGCGSSRGKVMSSSYYGIGLSINFGDGYDYETNPDGNRERFAALTRYKLQVLDAAVKESRIKGSIDRFSYRLLRFPLRVAIRLHDRQRYNSAKRWVQVFQYVSGWVQYGVVENENYSGEHDARASNIEFMYTDSIIPFH